MSFFTTLFYTKILDLLGKYTILNNTIIHTIHREWNTGIERHIFITNCSLNLVLLRQAIKPRKLQYIIVYQYV